MQCKDDNQSPWNRWLLEFMLGACHELLKNTGRPQFRRHMVIHIPQNSLPLVESINEEGRPPMWDILGETYSDEGNLEKAEKMYQQALEGRETMLGP